MQIYSFEFTARTIKWKLFDYKGMKFIGTDSIRFPSNRNFIRVDGLEHPDSIKFDLCRFYKPIGEITESCRIDINPYNMNISIRPSEMDSGENLMIMVIDKTIGRVKAIKKFYEDMKFVDVIKRITTDEFIILLFRIAKDYVGEYTGPLLEFKEFNPLLRQEYCHEIRYSYMSSVDNKVLLSAKDVKDETLDDNNERFNLLFHRPVTRNFIVKKEYEDELIFKLDDMDYESRITSIGDEDSMEDIISCILNMVDTATAVTYYRMEPIKSDELKEKIKYNFIMLPTGKIIEGK